MKDNLDFLEKLQGINSRPKHPDYNGRNGNGYQPLTRNSARPPPPTRAINEDVTCDWNLLEFSGSGLALYSVIFICIGFALGVYFAK